MTQAATSGNTDTPLVAAIAYADAGLFVIPLIRGTKRPAFAECGPGYRGVATQEPELLERWFAPGQHDVGIVPGLSGHAVADVDVKPPHRGAESLPKLEQLTGHWPNPRWSDVTATSLSPNRGWHYWFTLPEGVAADTLRGTLAPGVELKVRGLVGVPPAVGRRWYRELAEGIVELPPELLAIARRPAQRVRPGNVDKSVNGLGMTALHKWLAKRPEGERNNALYWCACRAAEMIERGEISPASAWMLVETAVKLGLPRGEAESTVASALGRVDAAAPPTLAPPAGGQLVLEEAPPAAKIRSGPLWEKVPRDLALDALPDPLLGLLVRVWLGRHYRTGELRTSTPLLAELGECDIQTMRRRLRRLRDDGWLVVESRPGHGGGLVLRLGERVNVL